MTEDRKLQAEIDRAEHARRLLGDSLLLETLQVMRAEVVRMWEECPARDAEGKEALWQLMKTAGKFESLLKGYVETGKLATANLKHFEERRGLRRVFG